MAHTRIQIDPEIMGGKPVIRGTRIPVELLLRKLGAGMTFDNLAHFSNELLEYLIYYNEFRPHQALNHTTPKAFAQTKSNIQNEPPRSAN